MKKLGSLSALIFLLFSLMIGSCSDSSVTDFKPTGQAALTSSPGSNPPATVGVTVTPSSGLSALGTATVSATVRDSTGANVPDGTTVSFTINNTSLGTIDPSAKTVSGIATGTFKAANIAGTVTVTVTAGTITVTTPITILGADVGSIEFVDAKPSGIGVKGSGQKETSVISFLVKDVNGQPAPNGTSVTFVVSGPKGGEVLVPTTASTTNGSAQTILQSGAVAGAVRVTASTTIVNNITISSSSTGVSIGGGAPSLTHFDLSATLLRLAGFSYNNLQSTITAYVADRFGNYNVLTGTSVSFYTEAGAIDRSNVTNNQGLTTVLFRTQDPRPINVVPDTFGAFAGFLESSYTAGGVTFNPRDGWSTILATTIGEETFTDANGNGVYDAGEPFIDLGEPFIDSNDNGVWDVGEFYVDFDKNGAYTPANGIWNGNAMIWTSIDLTFTAGSPSFGPNTSRFADLSGTQINTFRIPNGGSQDIYIYVSDFNQNLLPPDSTITVTNTGGKLTGGGTFKLADGRSRGPYIIPINLSDSDGVSKKQDTASITVDITTNIASIGTVVDKMTLSGIIDFGPAISTTTLPDGASGSAYSAVVLASGGASPYTWSASGLPVGMSINSSTGVISGTLPVGVITYNVTVTVTDSTIPALTDIKGFTLAAK